MAFALGFHTFGGMGSIHFGGLTIALSAATIAEGAANNTAVGTASLQGVSTGTPSWSITDASGTFQINSSTGAVTVLSNTDLNYANFQSFPVTISETGSTPAALALNTIIVIIP